MSLLLGIDIGTTHCKAALYKEDGTLVGLASRPTPTVDDGGGSAHWEPGELWNTVVAIVRETVAKAEQAGHSRDEIVGAAASSPGEAGTLLDAQGRELCPFIAWYDPRTIPQKDWWARIMSLEAISEVTGLPLDHIYSVNKLMWLREHAPDAWNRATSWVIAADWVGFRLTGIPFTSASLASRSMVYDLRTGEWSSELLEVCGVPARLLPPPVDSGTAIGTILPEVAKELGLPPGVKVAAGGLDHLCAALASGITEPGHLLNSMGTAEVVLSLMSELPASLNHPGITLGSYVVPKRYFGMITLRTSGYSLEWVAREILGRGAISATQTEGAARGEGASSSGATSGREGVTRSEGASKRERYQALLDAVSRGRGAQSGLLYFPFLRGSLLPENEPRGAGAFVGLRDHHTAADLARAVIDGLAFETQVMREAIEAVTGLPTPTLRAVGGGIHNRVWMQVKADVTGLTVEVPKVEEAGTLGCALLSGIAAGVYRSAAEAVQKTYHVADEYHPNPEMTRLYRPLYAEYKALRESLIKSGRRLRDLVDGA